MEKIRREKDKALIKAWQELQNISRHHVERVYVKAAKAAKKRYGGEFDPKSPAVKADIDELLNRFKSYQLNAFKKRLDALIDEVKEKAIQDQEEGKVRKYHLMLKDEIRHEFKRYRKTNSDLIAQWLCVNGRNMGIFRVSLNGGNRLFKWVAQPDACGVCRGLHGKVIDFSRGELFAQKGDILRVTDPDTGKTHEHKVFEDLLHPPVHPRCRCEIVPVDRSTDIADKVHAAIGKEIQNKDVEHVIRVGKLIREEVEKRMGKDAGADKEAYRHMVVLESLNPSDPLERELIERVLHKNRKQYVIARLKRSQITVQVLREIRDMGYTKDIRQKIEPELYYAFKETLRKEKEKAIRREDKFYLEELEWLDQDLQPDIKGEVLRLLYEKAGNYLPRSWLVKSADEPLFFTTSKSFDSCYLPDNQVLNIRQVSDAEDTISLIHEMAHRSEQVYPKLREMVQTFYEWRTQGEKERFMSQIAREDGVFPEELTPNIAFSKGKRDRFVNWYQAMPNGQEILSTGMQGVFDPYDYTYPIAYHDPEYYDFILGLLAAL